MKGLYNVNDTVFGNGFSLTSVREIKPAAAREIVSYLKKKPHEIYGSSAQFSQGSRNNRPPSDVDIAIGNVGKAKDTLSIILKRHGYKVMVKMYPEYQAAQILTLRKNNKWDTLIDLQPLEKHQTERREFTNEKPVKPRKDKVSGLFIQSPNDQLRRKHSAILNPDMPPHRVQKDSYDAVALFNDLNVSNNLKKDLRLLTGMPSFDEVMCTKWKGESPTMLAKRLESEKKLEKGSLVKATRPPLTYNQKKAWIKFAKAHPEIHPDDINFDKNGKIVVMKSRSD